MASVKRSRAAHVHSHAPHTSITFSLETLIRVVVLSVGGAATIWATTSGLRSDVRNILTQMESETEQRELQSRLVEERMNTMRESINDQRRRGELTAIELNSVKEMILKLPQVTR